jgi:hypothetical protein
MAINPPQRPEPAAEGRLVNAVRLLELLFDEQSRPSLRWLRAQQKARTIPFIKIGRMVFFDPQTVREALAKRTIKIRG